MNDKSLNDKLKRALAAEFAPPEPMRKREFLRKVRGEGVSSLGFVLIQLPYIRKRVWLLSLAVLAAGVWAALRTGPASVWAASALMPWLAVTAVTENTRSAACGMAELEMSTRFSLGSLTLARLGTVGAVHFVLLCTLSLVWGGDGISAVRAGIYILTPYLLTLCLGLPLTRKTGGGWPCFGAAALVSGVGLFFRGVRLYEPELVKYWVLAMALMALVAAAEYKKTIFSKEALLWSLS